MTTLDPYSVLGVAPDARQAELEAAYKARLVLLHPDRMAGRSEREREVAALMLAGLQDAWALVGDARARARYDAERAWQPPQQPEPRPGPVRAAEPERVAEPPPPSPQPGHGRRPPSARRRRGPWWWRAATWLAWRAWREAGEMAAGLEESPRVPVLFWWPTGTVAIGVAGFVALVVAAQFGIVASWAVVLTAGAIELWWQLAAVRGFMAWCAGWLRRPN
jgi:DnaJ-domain-containing protein 1